MLKTPPCYLTMRDFSLLESLIDSDISDYAFLRLLRRKLSSATITFSDDLDEAVAGAGRHVEFQIDGAMVDSCILVHEEGAAPSRLKLSITTIRGLALFGLREGASISVECADGRTERLHLIKVYRPQRTQPAVREIGARGISIDRAGARASVAIDPDDDPGPAAA